MERVLIDDSRLNIIATDDATGMPVELRTVLPLRTSSLSRSKNTT